MYPVPGHPPAWRSRLVLFLMFVAFATPALRAVWLQLWPRGLDLADADGAVLPDVIVAVMIDEPPAGGHYGGTVAAPVFAAVVQDTLRALNVAPDAPVDDIIVPLEAVDEEP